MSARCPTSGAWAVAALVGTQAAVASVADAQTLQTVAAGQTTCTTAGGEGLSRQLVDVQTCLHPGQFVSFASPSVTATSNRVHLFGQLSAAQAIAAASASVPLSINSGFRPISDQYLLARSGACGVVAEPGSSNHQSGRAIDVANTVTARTALEAAGCAWFGSSDAVHYDCPGSDLRADAIFAFQRLWNLNRASMPLDEDGLYGPMTEAALAASPAAGFPIGSATLCTEMAPDAGMPDAGMPDGGMPDAGVPDVGVPDVGGVDLGTSLDAGVGVPDADDAPPTTQDGCGCAVVGRAEAAPPRTLVLLALLALRRLRRPGARATAPSRRG